MPPFTAVSRSIYIKTHIVMKKLLLLLLMVVCFVPAMQAQQAAFEQAVAKYRTAKSATATAVMVKHNKALTKNKTYTGSLSMKDPDKVAIVVGGGKEQLVMNGNTFTMVQGGHKRVASAKTASQFAAFKAVLQSVLSGGKTNISTVKGVKIAQQGGKVVVTMTPDPAKHLMFSSFVLTLNKTTNAMESLTLNSKRGYTEYRFTNFKFGGAVSDKVFIP